MSLRTVKHSVYNLRNVEKSGNVRAFLYIIDKYCRYVNKIFSELLFTNLCFDDIILKYKIWKRPFNGHKILQNYSKKYKKGIDKI